MNLFGFVLVTFLFSNSAHGYDDFGYDGKNGPQHWGDNFKTCLGKYQSPIDIEDKDVRTATFSPLELLNVQTPHPAYMTNNGHTVMIKAVDPDPENDPTITGGPLNDTYVFQQLHFHWGESDDEGSEDLINNHSFSMELHAVFWKKAYETSDEAMKHADGLTVLAFLFQAKDEPNPTFESIVSQIPEIASVGGNSTITDVNILNKLIVPKTVASQDYYTYRGSLTTPPCLEIVQWIDFIEPQTISHEQIAAFRSIKGHDGSNLTHNYRPVQPLDDRAIYRNNRNGSSDPTKPTETPTPSEITKETITTQTSAPTTPKITEPPSPPANPTTKPTNPPTTTTTTTAKPNVPETPNGGDASGSNTKQEEKDPQKSGQDRIWSTSALLLICGTFFLLP